MAKPTFLTDDDGNIVFPAVRITDVLFPEGGSFDEYFSKMNEALTGINHCLTLLVGMDDVNDLSEINSVLTEIIG